MDHTEAFSNAFCNSQFSTFSEFQKSLYDFQESTGSRFIFKRTFLFPLDSPRRGTLVYKSIHYVCSENKQRTGTQCSAFFTVGCRNGFLYVSKYDMVHNHKMIILPAVVLKTEEYAVITDYTLLFMKMFPSLVFNSFAELDSKMEEFQAKTGCMYAKRHTCPWSKEEPDKQRLVYKKFNYECFHFGYSKRTMDGHENKTLKTGCKSVIYVTCRNDQLLIGRFDMRHNHPISGSSGNVYRRNRRLNADQQAAIKEHLKSDPQVFMLKEYIQNSFHVYMTTSEVRNLKRKLQPRKIAKAAIGSTLKKLQEQGMLELLVDEEGTYQLIAFTTPELIKGFHQYPEVIQIEEVRLSSDHPYSIYCVSIVDRDVQTRAVFFAFLFNKGEKIFRHMLKAFKNLMGLKVDELETVCIDIESAKSHVVRQELSWSRLLLRQVLVLKDVKSQINPDMQCGEKALFQYFYTALTTQSRSTYLRCLEDIISASPALWEYINDTWIPCADQWAEHLRLSQVTFGVDKRSNWSETFEPLHSAFNEDSTIDDCADVLLDLALRKGTNSSCYDQNPVAHYPGQPEDIKTLLRLISEPSARCVLNHLSEPAGENVLTLLSERKCFCSFNRQWRLPCSHLIAAARAGYVPLQSLLKDSRWLVIWPSAEEVLPRSPVLHFADQGWFRDAKFSRTSRLQTLQDLAVTSESEKLQRRAKEFDATNSKWLFEGANERRSYSALLRNHFQ
uniref:SWIM zinc finger protein n=5 Tax=Schistocephalus solidus TaxID=70667 RepID=A0A0X3PMB7_SCHSO